MIRSTENNPSCPPESIPDGVNHRFAVNNTIILGEEDPVAMKKNIPDIVRRNLVISLRRLEHETPFTPSSYDCMVAGHGITRPFRQLSPTINLSEGEH